MPKHDTTSSYDPARADPPRADLARAERTRAEILRAAKQLFALHGVGGVSMNDIAQAAGVSKASVFYHFGSKADLHYEIVHSIADRAAILLERLASGEGEAGEDLRGFAEGHLRDLLDDPDGTRMMIMEIVSGSPEHIHTLAESFFEGNFTRLVDLVRRHQQEESWRGDVDPAFVATLLIAANVFFFMAQPLLRHFKEASFADRPEFYSRMLTELLLDGLASSRDKGTGA